MRRFLPVASGLFLSLFAGCKDDAPQVQATCYSGVVLGTTCLDGVLIQVTSAQPAGKPLRLYLTYRDSIVGSNVIAAVNDLGTLAKVGQKLSFTYTNSPNNQGPLRPCPANMGPLAVPHLVLANVSGEACAN